MQVRNGMFFCIFLVSLVRGDVGQTTVSVDNGTSLTLKVTGEGDFDNKGSQLYSEPLGFVGSGKRLEIDWIPRPLLGVNEKAVVRDYRIIPAYPAVAEDFGFPIIVRVNTGANVARAELIAGGKGLAVEPFKPWPKTRISPYVEAELQCYLNALIPDFALILRPVQPKDYIDDFAVPGKLAIVLDNQTKTRWAITLTGLEPKPVTNVVGESVIKGIALIPEDKSQRNGMASKLEIRLNPLVNTASYRPQTITLSQLTTQNFPVVSRCLNPIKCIPIANDAELSQYISRRFKELIDRYRKGEIQPGSDEEAWVKSSPDKIIKTLKQELDTTQKITKTSIETIRTPRILRIVLKDI